MPSSTVPPEGHANITYRSKKIVQLPAVLAKQLAYFETNEGVGVLAPRGCHGFETGGSAGSTLFVTPQPLKAEYLISEDFENFKGPIIEVTTLFAGTSGRYSVAEFIARLFAEHRKFVDYVLENFPSASKDECPIGPYKQDKLIYRDSTTVEYVTPPHSN